MFANVPILILVWRINRTKINYSTRKWHESAGTPAGLGIPLSRSQTRRPKMTELASGAIMQSTPSQSMLGEADETPAIVIIGWPARDRLSPMPFRLTRILMPASSPPL
jgi:hypothetical protein